MFTPGRYIVIDDNIDEMRDLVEALHALGAPAIGVHYDAAAGVRPELLVGARVLFLDLHLIGGVQIGDQKQAFDVVIQLLETGIGETSGPYIVVLWTSHAEQQADFEKRLIERLSPEKRPLAILHLNKNDYLRLGLKANGAQLQKDVTDAITKDPRLHAMLKWEHDVLAAAGATLSALGALIPPVNRTPSAYGERLDELLSVLACAAAGRAHAKSDVRAAVGEALLPILNDRLRNQSSSEDDAAVWDSAVTMIDEADKLDEAGAARLNTMLHLAMPPAEASLPTDWGAVVRLPDQAMEDGAMTARFGMSFSDLKTRSYPVHRKNDRKYCIPVLVRLGAACDYAQSKVGPIPYNFATLVPEDRPIKELSKRLALLDTPVLDVPGMGPARLWVDARYQITLTPADVAGWNSLFRLREQLLMQVAAHCAEYAMRPGIVAIRPPEPDEDGDGPPAAPKAPAAR